MHKYVDTRIVFEEVPDEITLAISISGCPNRCPGCHSPYLAGDVGDPLTEDFLLDLIRNNPGITCVCLMGGDSDPDEIVRLLKVIKEVTGLLTCWYSGCDMNYSFEGLKYLDYIKTGPYIASKGALDSPETNQRFHSVYYNSLDDSIALKNITYKFQKQ